ncbi:hypothetical protein BJ944DRAFT_242699 [Cunninghamella echinulata]|nr:hypothetical protein BJ944DRAFT_242699 [Cunninghamella echinulata]
MVYELGKSTLSYFKVMDSQYNQKEEEPIPFIEVHCRLADQVTWVGHSDQHDRDAFRGFLLQQKDNLDHIHLASLSRKGLKAYQEDKKDMEEWEYLDTNDDEPVYNEAEEGEEEEGGGDDDNDDDVNKYEVIEKEIEYVEEKKETSNSDDYDESEEEDDHDEEFLLY